MQTLKDLQPAALWAYFEEICQIPRPSKKEERILNYLKGFAERHGLTWKQDAVGNLVIIKPAAPGYERAPWVILQSHVDMVCEKNSGTAHDFDRDPIRTYIEDGWVKAYGTTLGADDGIGMAAQLAILADGSLEHGPLECLFTVDEETGMTGAFGLEEDFLQGRILLNLDSEDDGELFIGCAGGVGTGASFSYKKVYPDAGQRAFHIQVSGLKGGHSGDDIHKHRGNAIKVLCRILWRLEREADMRLAEIHGGNLRNAIAREARALVSVPESRLATLQELFHTLAQEIILEQQTAEPDLKIDLREAIMPNCLIDFTTQHHVLNALYACPHGVLAMSADMPGLVETSTNLASVVTDDHGIHVATSQRSAVRSALYDAAHRVASVFDLAGASYSIGDSYPGWKPNVNSQVLGIMRASYLKLFEKEPKVLAIHAGLECGLIGEKFPGMDMISYGPTVRGAHSPDERVEISTVQKFWDLTVETLKQIH